MRNRKRTLILLAGCAVLSVAAAAVGISDNPPGIALAYLAATSLVLAFVHPWRASRRYRYLLYGSAAGFVVFGLLHNVSEGLAGASAGSGLLHGLLSGLGGLFFLLAVLLCPPGLVVGALGALVCFIKERRNSGRAPTAV